MRRARTRTARRWGWAQSYGSAAEAQQAALSECSTRGGGSGCIVRVWGCNGPVVEEGLGLDRDARRQVQLGLRAAGYDPGGADGLFGPRTRAAIRSWQTSRGARANGYLDRAAVGALRTAGASGPAAAPAPAVTSPPGGTAEQETVFWQSIANSANPAEFEAYLGQFPNGVFSALARARLAALQSPAAGAVAAGPREGVVGSPATGGRVPATTDRPGVAAVAAGNAAGDARRGPGEVFRDCADCPEMVVLAGGRLALGRYEVTVGEYRAFASATGGDADSGCDTLSGGDSRQDPGFRQTDQHPVTCVSWDDAQEYVSWLSGTTGATYRLPTEEEWDRAAAGTPEGSGCGSAPDQRGSCPVGSYGANAAGLADMVGNLWEWTADCWGGDCSLRVIRGGAWYSSAGRLRPGARGRDGTSPRYDFIGIRVARALGAP